ncbi:unnamed protein product [Auanema sp. JU1783]|nr:unnamed protein product [Auanema sp. JU1783]
MYSIFVLVCWASLTACQYDPSIETSKAGYEEAEQQIGPQVIPPEYGTGKEQLKYVDERTNDVLLEFDKIFDLFREYVRKNQFGHSPKDIEYAGKLDQIHLEWKHSVELAPPGVQQDFLSGIQRVSNFFSSGAASGLFDSLVSLFTSFTHAFTSIASIWQDAPSEPVHKPDWQIDFENAMREQQNQRRRLRMRLRHRRHHRSTDNNELESSELDTLPFARQTTRRAATTRRTTVRATTRRPTTARKPQATTRRAQTTTRRPQTTTRKGQATTRRTGTTKKAAISQSAQQTAEQEQNVDVDNGIHETYIKAPRIINVFVDDDQPADLIAQAVAAQYFEFEKGDPNP